MNSHIDAKAPFARLANGVIAQPRYPSFAAALDVAYE